MFGLKLEALIKNKVFRAYTDPGHGWIAVKRNVLDILNIADKITPFSYQKGHTVYLEEDCDASLFFKLNE